MGGGITIGIVDVAAGYKYKEVSKNEIRTSNKKTKK